MNGFFEHQRSSFKRNYIRNLIALASEDGDLDTEERKLIVNIGLRRGLKDWQINELLEETTKHVFFVPDSLGNRMNLLYDIMQIVYADGKVNSSEVAFVKSVLHSLQLDPEVLTEILSLFDEAVPTIGQWNDFMRPLVGKTPQKFTTIL